MLSYYFDLIGWLFDVLQIALQVVLYMRAIRFDNICALRWLCLFDVFFLLTITFTFHYNFTLNTRYFIQRTITNHSRCQPKEY